MSIDAAQEFARRGIAQLSRVWEVDTKRFEMLGDFRSTKVCPLFAIGNRFL